MVSITLKTIIMDIRMKQLTIEEIEASISAESYSKIGEKTTICFVTLQNGFEVLGTSGVVDASKYDFEIGKKFARETVIKKLWELLGFEKQCQNFKQ